MAATSFPAVYLTTDSVRGPIGATGLKVPGEA
jgi:hypothetical protein